MKAIEIDEMLHKIREERSAERKGLTPEEKLRLERELFERDKTELGLKTMKLPEKSKV